MADSPFASFANFEATFQVATGNLVADRKGNLRPQQATVAVVAQMDQPSKPVEAIAPGIDQSAIYLKGTLISPQPLPSAVTPASPCAATWNGVAGQFFLEFTGRDSILSSLGIGFLDELKGWFQPGNFAVQGDPYVPPTPTPTPAPTPGDAGTALYSPEYPASVALSALRVVRVADGQLAYASSDSPSHAFTVLGILASAVAQGANAAPLTEGTLTDSAWAWTVGTPIWLGVAGQLTQTPPTSGFLLQVAIAKTPTQIDFEIQEPTIL